MKISMLIGGEAAQAETGRTYLRHDPVTGEVATEAPAASVADALRAVQAAHAAFPGWAATAPGQRRAILNKAADKLDAMTPDIVAGGIAETGATGPWLGFNCMFGANILREAAAMTTQITGDIIPSDKPGCSPWPSAARWASASASRPGTRRSSLACARSPWPIACGNTVVLKASETVARHPPR